MRLHGQPCPLTAKGHQLVRPCERMRIRRLLEFTPPSLRTGEAARCADATGGPRGTLIEGELVVGGESGTDGVPGCPKEKKRGQSSPSRIRHKPAVAGGGLLDQAPAGITARA